MSIFFCCIHTTLEQLGEAEKYHVHWLKEGLSRGSDLQPPASRSALGVSSPAAGSLLPRAATGTTSSTEKPAA